MFLDTKDENHSIVYADDIILTRNDSHKIENLK